MGFDRLPSLLGDLVEQVADLVGIERVEDVPQCPGELLRLLDALFGEDVTASLIDRLKCRCGRKGRVFLIYRKFM